MHFLMTAFGSYGDVHPIAGLASALCRRGHEVTIIANPHFRSVIESTGQRWFLWGRPKNITKWLTMPICGTRCVVRC